MLCSRGTSSLYALNCCLTVCTMLAMPPRWLPVHSSHMQQSALLLPLQGGTYGGSILGCAAANATLDAIEEDGMLENAQQRGIQLTKVGCSTTMGLAVNRYPLTAQVCT